MYVVKSTIAFAVIFLLSFILHFLLDQTWCGAFFDVYVVGAFLFTVLLPLRAASLSIFFFGFLQDLSTNQPLGYSSIAYLLATLVSMALPPKITTALRFIIFIIFFAFSKAILNLTLSSLVPGGSAT